MTNRGESGIPVVVHLDARTFRAIEVAAHRASVLVGREVTMRELIARRLADAVVGGPRPASPPLYSAEERAQMTNGREGKGARLTEQGRDAIRALTKAGKSAEFIADAIGCHPRTVANFRLKLREEQQDNETRTT